ncbi:uncharacterized protein LOC62_04G006263 [Vanrija pseudolonga]|uniref:CCD97-like C-terminal domain-containing protein n=1 Tax=Vanrija pseudolonga TaxID=143232 RepID=A0AAF0YA81_9TREE|nr:hypothetical protein LOC62_04G006263 [Vanrija pseudolonga]
MPTPLPPDLVEALTAHLGAVPSSANPLDVLAAHLPSLPPALAAQVGAHTTAKERTRIPAIKARRVLYGTGSAPSSSSSSSGPNARLYAPGVAAVSTPPPDLTAERGRQRWPLLWERLGGDPRPAESTTAQADEERWAGESFMPGSDAFVGRLGRVLREDEEVREWEATRAARAAERRLDEQGEEFDDSDDDEDDVEGGAQGSGAAGARTNGGGLPHLPYTGTGAADQAAVEREFEKRLLELFIDGLDTLDYTPIDFSPADDPIAARDAEDRWFDDEAPSGGGVGNGASRDRALENGEGEYDY